MEQNYQNKNVGKKRKEKRDTIGLILAIIVFIGLMIAIGYGIYHALVFPTI